MHGALALKIAQVVRATLEAFLRRRVELWEQLPPLTHALLAKVSTHTHTYTLEAELKATEESVTKTLRAKASSIAVAQVRFVTQIIALYTVASTLNPPYYCRRRRLRKN
jgi:hypothetical protein